MTNVTEITGLFSTGFENTLVGSIELIGFVILLIFAYICFRVGMSLDAVVVVMVPIIVLLAFEGFLPLVVAYLTIMAAGVLLAMGIIKLIS